MAKKTSKKSTRKRRSFFEPESKVLADWLAEQNDLGVSLQLIIVDAIRNYGDGDVIQAFLTARERVPGEPAVTSSVAHPQAAEQVVAPVKPAPKAQTPSIEEDAPVEDDADTLSAEPKATTPKPVAPKSPKTQPKAAAEPKPEPQEVPTPDAASTEADPLDIMFQDIGSQYNQ